jgi:predicted dinucleotide-binding enzyme
MKQHMNTKQVVAVIGASGNMGSALAKSLSKGNYRVLLNSSKTNVIHSLLNEIKSNNPIADIEIVGDYTEACWEADIIILAIPYSAEKQVAASIRSVVNQKIIIRFKPSG